jgi:hypothetical protein
MLNISKTILRPSANIKILITVITRPFYGEYQSIGGREGIGGHEKSELQANSQTKYTLTLHDAYVATLWISVGALAATNLQGCPTTKLQVILHFAPGLGVVSGYLRVGSKSRQGAPPGNCCNPSGSTLLSGSPPTYA